jgi:hypothetical protein
MGGLNRSHLLEHSHLRAPIVLKKPMCLLALEVGHHHQALLQEAEALHSIHRLRPHRMRSDPPRLDRPDDHMAGPARMPNLPQHQALLPQTPQAFTPPVLARSIPGQRRLPVQPNNPLKHCSRLSLPQVLEGMRPLERHLDLLQRAEDRHLVRTQGTRVSVEDGLIATSLPASTARWPKLAPQFAVEVLRDKPAQTLVLTCLRHRHRRQVRLRRATVQIQMDTHLTIFLALRIPTMYLSARGNLHPDMRTTAEIAEAN